MTPEALNEKTPFLGRSKHRHPAHPDNTAGDQAQATKQGGRCKRMCPYTDVDCGWAWVALAASFCANTIMGAQYCSVNIFYAEFLQIFGQSRTYTSWFGSLNSILLYSSGSLGSYLLPKIGIRNLFFLASAAICASFVTISYSHSLLLNIGVYGLFGGLGYGFVLTGVVAVNGRYFRKYTYMATSVSFVGGGLGTMIYGPVLQGLIAEYGLRGASLIYGAVALNLCVAGCAVFPERAPRTKRIVAAADSATKPTTVAVIPVTNGAIQQQDGEGRDVDVGRDCEKAIEAAVARCRCPGNAGRVIVTKAETVPLLRSHREDVEVLDDTDRSPAAGSCRRRLSDRDFWILSVIAFTWGFGAITFLAIFKDLTTSSGMPELFGTAVLLFGGGNTFTRVVISFLSFGGAILRLSVAMLFGSVVFCLFSVADQPWSFMTLSALAGMFLGFTFVMLPVSVGTVYGRKEMAVTYGYVLFSVGLSNAAGPPLVGFLRDSTGNYVSGLCAISLSTLIGAIFSLWLFIRQLRKKAQIEEPLCDVCQT